MLQLCTMKFNVYQFCSYKLFKTPPPNKEQLDSTAGTLMQGMGPFINEFISCLFKMETIVKVVNSGGKKKKVFGI